MESFPFLVPVFATAWCIQSLFMVCFHCRLRRVEAVAHENVNYAIAINPRYETPPQLWQQLPPEPSAPPAWGAPAGIL